MSLPFVLFTPMTGRYPGRIAWASLSETLWSSRPLSSSNSPPTQSRWASSDFIFLVAHSPKSHDRPGEVAAVRWTPFDFLDPRNGSSTFFSLFLSKCNDCKMFSQETTGQQKRMVQRMGLVAKTILSLRFDLKIAIPFWITRSATPVSLPESPPSLSAGHPF